MEFGQTEWCIIVAFLGLLTIAALFTQKLNRSVADFLVAGRGAGRYLLTNANGMAWLGAASLIGQFQIHYDAGFSAFWWYSMVGPVVIIVTFSGWVTYRWRATRILTQAQLFQLRYSRNYRVFVGLITFITGIIFFCILPTVGSRFFVAYCGLPEVLTIGPLTLRTFNVCMAILIMIAWVYTFLGGQITVLVTDFLQGIFCLLVFLAIFIFIMTRIEWSTITEGLAYAEEGKSMIHPFKMENLDTYNPTYFIWLIFFMVFMGPTSLNAQSTVCAGKTPHESKMALILGNVRHMTISAVMLLMPICAFVVFHHPQFAEKAVGLSELLGQYTPQVQRQIQVPLAMSSLMPPVLVGAFAASVLAAFITTNDTQLLTFGGMFIQDIVLPFRKKPLSPKAHMRLLRISIIFIGVSVFVLGSFYDWMGRRLGHELDLQMFWAVSSLLQAGVVAGPMIGALYWKYATTASAWITAISSIIFFGLGMFLCYQKSLPYTPIQITLVGLILLIMIYMGSSLIDHAIRKFPPFNLDRLLHRGKYEIDSEHNKPKDTRGWVTRVLGMTKEFTKGDKIVYILVLIAMVQGSIVFGIGMCWEWLGETTEAGWLIYWRATVWYFFIGGTLVTIWMTVGGFRDLIALFSDLKSAARDVHDDGRVIDHQNADEVE